MAALPATARIQLVSTTAEAARALADGGTVSRVYQNSLTEYAPRGDVVYIVTDTATLAGLGAEYTVLRDYGDVLLGVRMNINDLTANFTTEFVLPRPLQYSGDAAKGLTAASGRLFFLLAAKRSSKEIAAVSTRCGVVRVGPQLSAANWGSTMIARGNQPQERVLPTNWRRLVVRRQAGPAT